MLAFILEMKQHVQGEERQETQGSAPSKQWHQLPAAATERGRLLSPSKQRLQGLEESGWELPD